MLVINPDHTELLPFHSALGLDDPLKAVRAVSNLIEAGAAIGLQFRHSINFQELAELRKKVRQSDVSPMFDATVCANLDQHAFWMSAFNSTGDLVALQAFRLDEATPNLSDWVLGWMIGLYARRRELIVPKYNQANQHSLTMKIRGPVAYHGEFWIEKHSNKHCFDIFSRLGLLLATLKWQPAAVWALTSQSMATRGHMIRAGYGHIEQSFLTWEWTPAGAEPNEWIAVADRRHLEFIISQQAAASQPIAAKRQP